MSELNMSSSDAEQYSANNATINVGDKLRCRDDSGSCSELVGGEWYEVTEVPAAEPFNIVIAGSDVHWALYRFDLIIGFLRPPVVVAEPNPYADWKSGDSVRCLEAADSGEFLADKHVYEIDNGPFFKSDKWRIRLVGLPKHEWNCERFERVAPIVDVHFEPDKPVVRVGSRVRCDDASGTGASLGEGNVYTVASVQPHGSDTFLRLNDCSGMGWDISRFTILPDEVAPSVPLPHADQSDVDLMHADEARRLADEHFMANGRELRLEIKAAIAAAVAKGESIAHVHISDSVFPAAVRWISKRGYSMSFVPGFTRGTISWQ